MNVITPRVICIEYCASMGKVLSVTVPYKDNFDRHEEHTSGMYCNASLKANIHIMKKKGYKFVGSVYGLNAFFVRNDCILNNLKELSCEEGWQPHYGRTYLRKISPNEQYNKLKDLKWNIVKEEGTIIE